MKTYFFDVKLCVTIKAEDEKQAKEKLKWHSDWHDYDIEEESEPRQTRYKDIKQAIQKTQP